MSEEGAHHNSRVGIPFVSSVLYGLYRLYIYCIKWEWCCRWEKGKGHHTASESTFNFGHEIRDSPGKGVHSNGDNVYVPHCFFFFFALHVLQIYRVNFSHVSRRPCEFPLCVESFSADLGSF